MNEDDYGDQNGMLEEILAHKRERQDKRRKSNDEICSAEVIRLTIKLFVNI